MATVTIRNLDDQLKHRLQLRAARHAGQVLAFDQRAAGRYATLVADGERKRTADGQR